MRDVKKVNIVFMCCTLMPLAVGFVLGLLNLDITNSLQMIIISQLVYALPVLIYLIVCGKSLKEALRIKKIRISNVFRLILFTYLITPVISLVNALSLIFSKNVISETITEITDNYPLGIAVLVVGVMPAILEESVYRGVFYNEYRKLNTRAAIILSALLFGLLHMNLNQFSYAFVLGAIFALVIEATDSIVSTMIMHFVINSTSVINGYLLPKLMEAAGISDTAVETAGKMDKIVMMQTATALFFPAIVGGVLAFLVFRQIAKKEGRYDAVKRIFGREEQQAGFFQFITIPLAVGMGICLYHIIGNLMS